ncbi:uncharacterized protein LOC114353098 [Ostrinia furnacalis]|uniref:uncharacterized protein LOC114353098 n=1 Tax=Ostrinia furnacalis TaxID=93504 RepID=UPI00103A7515|nr:uncharacterized protein LOC114353098 [Ostrinia furnacalis]
MEVSNEIKEDIRKTQSDLKNAIRIHQVWVARLQDDENNIHLKTKVKEAERDIIAIGQTQKLVVDKLRKELELYQQRLKARNKQVNIENDNRYVAQQIRDHQIQFRNRNRSSLLKPSVLNEIHVKIENNENFRENMSDSENELKSSNEKENSNHSESDEKEKFKGYLPSVYESRTNFVNALNKSKEQITGKKTICLPPWIVPKAEREEFLKAPLSPSPPPPPIPDQGEPVSQERFLRCVGLITPVQKEILEKRRTERSLRSAAKRQALFGPNYDAGLPKRNKKVTHYPYLQSHNDPPQTRSAKLRKQQTQYKTLCEGMQIGLSSENKVSLLLHNKPAWVAALPPSLTVEPVFSPIKKVCQGCGRNDVPSLLVCCDTCATWQHTGCSAGGLCVSCRAPLPDPAVCSAPDPDPDSQLYRDKLAERKRLQEKNMELCIELRKLEARAASLKENMDEHNAEKRQLLADQIKTQRNLQKLLDFISQFKETSVSVRSTSLSETGSEISKSNEE